MALGISDAVSLSGRILERVKQSVTLDLQERIIELREAVLNAKDEILNLRKELADLKRATAERDQLRFDIEEESIGATSAKPQWKDPFANGAMTPTRSPSDCSRRPAGAAIAGDALSAAGPIELARRR